MARKLGYVYKFFFKAFLICFGITFATLFLIELKIILRDNSDSHIEDHDYFVEENERKADSKQDSKQVLSNDEIVPDPIIMWWYQFTHENGVTRKCGNVQCFFTNNRKYMSHKSMKVFLMYGTSFDYMDLPFPRLGHHEWALLHEESPKNVYLYSHPETMELFNHTATFKRQSDFPLPTLWLSSLEFLESTEFLVPVGEKTEYLSELALVNYVHSDCGCPSDRDHFVDMMQKYMKVDSYGKCRHNKDLPESLSDALLGMDKPDFYKIVAKYKFTLTFENAICDDYMTEKLWRPLHVGSVPIIIGSAKVMDFLPDKHSAILVENFTSMKKLVDLLQHLNRNDDEYKKYLSFKRPGGVTNQYLRDHMKQRPYGAHGSPANNWVSRTECFLCERIHENMKRKEAGLPPVLRQATVEHYGCPKPKRFKGSGEDDLRRVDDDWFAQEWISTSYEAKALKTLWSKRVFNYTQRQVRDIAETIREEDKRK